MNQNVNRCSLAAALLLLALAPVQRLCAQPTFSGNQNIQHVLLISIDGMHALDFINCANGISGANGGNPFCPNVAQLKPTGINYLYAATSRPSDSFPGLMALMTGGSPRTVGAFYDDAYDRSLDPPAVATGDNLAAGTCTAYERQQEPLRNTTRGSISTKPNSMAARPAETAGSIRSIPADWCATPVKVVRRFILGTLCEPTRSLA
jgi:hypothetical protein